MANNIEVIIKGTIEIYRYDITGLTFVRNEPIYINKVFITTTNGNHLIDGVCFSINDGNDVYKQLMDYRNVTEYDSYCGRYKFKNIRNCDVKVVKLTDKDYVMDLASKFNKSIDGYVEYIDDGSQYFSTLEHNKNMARMEKALLELAETLE